jgi:hypothetical protein
MVHKKRVDFITAERRGIPVIERDEAHAIETGQSLFGTKPQVTIRGLGDRKHGVLG